MAFTFSYDPTSDSGKVRMLITDRDETNAIFSDDEIGAFLELNSGSVYLAAAAALRSIATSETLILKKIQSLDLQTDGPAMANALNALAEKFEAREMQGGYFDVAEQVNTSWQWDERIVKQWLRGAL